MTDLPAMDRCPVSKHGGHELNAILPDADGGDMTLFCDRCGAMRRVPVSGALLSGSLDDADAEAILRAVQR